MPPGIACATARADLTRTVESARHASGAEKFGTLVRAGYLLSGRTLVKIASSHLVFGGGEEFATRPLASAIDYLISVARHATVHPEMTVDELREVPGVSLASLRAGGLGFQEGLKKAVTILKTTVDPDEVQRDFDLHGVHFEHAWLERAVNQIAASHGAIYKPFWDWARAKSLYYQATVQAMHEGLTGAARTDKVAKILAATSDEMKFRAIEDANYAAFQNPTAVGRMLSRMKASLRDAGTDPALIAKSPRTAAAMRVSGQAGYAVASIEVPFTQIPPALAGVFIDYSPLGVLKTLAEQLPEASRGQARLATGLARVGVGSGALMALGYALGRHGLLTGSYPTSPGEIAAWQTEGKQENSLKVHGHWLNLQPVEPLVFMAIFGANLAAAKQANPEISPSDLAATGLVSMGKTLSDQPYLMGVQQLTSALQNPQRSAPSFAAHLVPIPPILGQLARSIDPTVRQTSGVGQRLLSQTPFSRYLPPKLDEFGRPETRPGGLAAQLVNPATATTAHDDAVTAELDRLRVFPGMPDRAVSVGRVRTPLTADQYNAELEATGPLLHRVLSDAITSPGYQQLADDEKQVALRKIIMAVRAAGTQATKARLLAAGLLKFGHYPSPVVPK